MEINILIEFQMNLEEIYAMDKVSKRNVGVVEDENLCTLLKSAENRYDSVNITEIVMVEHGMAPW